MALRPQKYPLGQTLQKEFPGFGIFEGTIKSYNPQDCLYSIQYQDGDTEEMDEIDLDRLTRRALKAKVSEEKEEVDDDNGSYSSYYDDEEEEEDPDEEDNPTEEEEHKQEYQATATRKGAIFTTDEKEYAWELAKAYKKEGSKFVNHAAFIPALAKALEQNEDYAKRLFASTKTYMWTLDNRKPKKKKRVAPPKSTTGVSPTNSHKKSKPSPKAKPNLPSFSLKGTLSYNEFCRVHIIRGFVLQDKKTPEKFELVRPLDKEEPPEELNGTFHTANFDQQVDIRFTKVARTVDNPSDYYYEVHGEGTSDVDNADFEITGTATPNSAAGVYHLLDLVLKKQYLTAPKKPQPPSPEDPQKEWKKELLAITGKIKRQKFAWPFLEPVDTAEVPDYLEKIQEPMDLSTIEKLIKKGDHYTTKKMLHSDLMLMVKNCKKYNEDEPTSPYLECADSLETFLGTLSLVEQAPLDP